MPIASIQEGNMVIPMGGKGPVPTIKDSIAGRIGRRATFYHLTLTARTKIIP